MADMASAFQDLAQSFSSYDGVDALCSSCDRPVLITRVSGRSRQAIDDQATYYVSRVNRFLYDYSKLDGHVNWQVKSDGKIIHEVKNGSHCLMYVIPDSLNADLITVYAFIVRPIESVSVSTWIEKDYARKLRRLIDDGVTDVDKLFRSLCEFYVDRSNRYSQFDDWEGIDDATEILEDMGELFGKRVGNLDGKDQTRWWAVNHALPQSEFGGQWDKVQHFFAGVDISEDFGENAGWTSAWAAEKVDTLKRVWGEIAGTRQSHQIGFDWADFEWTAAGASLTELLKNSSNSECKNIMKAFADGRLVLSKIYKPTGIVGGFGEVSPAVSPLVVTNIDRVKKQVKEMTTLVSSYK